MNKILLSLSVLCSIFLASCEKNGTNKPEPGPINPKLASFYGVDSLSIGSTGEFVSVGYGFSDKGQLSTLRHRVQDNVKWEFIDDTHENTYVFEGRTYPFRNSYYLGLIQDDNANDYISISNYVYGNNSFSTYVQSIQKITLEKGISQKVTSDFDKYGTIVDLVDFDNAYFLAKVGSARAEDEPQPQPTPDPDPTPDPMPESDIKSTGYTYVVYNHNLDVTKTYTVGNDIVLYNDIYKTFSNQDFVTGEITDSLIIAKNNLMTNAKQWEKKSAVIDKNENVTGYTYAITGNVIEYHIYYVNPNSFNGEKTHNFEKNVKASLETGEIIE